MSLAQETLRALGGDKIAVPGAKLRGEIARARQATDEDFGAYLHSQGKTFTRFLREDAGILVHPRTGTDMAAGFVGARVPAPTTTARQRFGKSLRPDAYAALTRVSEHPAGYDRSTDRFLLDQNEDGTLVRLPIVTWESLETRRREFCDFLRDVKHEVSATKLEDALNAPENRLGAFQLALTHLGLSRKWHDFNYDSLTGILDQWAMENEVERSPDWVRLDLGDRPHRSRSSRDMLAMILSRLSDEDIHRVLFPFGIVEAILREVDEGLP